MSSRVISYGNYWWRCPGLNGRPAAYEADQGRFLNALF